MEKTTSQGDLRSVLLIKYYSGDQIKNNEMGEAYSMSGKRSAYRVLVEKTLETELPGRPRGLMGG